MGKIVFGSSVSSKEVIRNKGPFIMLFYELNELKDYSLDDNLWVINSEIMIYDNTRLLVYGDLVETEDLDLPF